MSFNQPPKGFSFLLLFVQLKWSESVALTTARKHISSFFTMPHKTPRNILLSYFSLSLPRPAFARTLDCVYARILLMPSNISDRSVRRTRGEHIKIQHQPSTKIKRGDCEMGKNIIAAVVSA